MTEPFGRITQHRTRAVKGAVLAAIISATLVLALAQPALAAASGEVTVHNGSAVCVRGSSDFRWHTGGSFRDTSARATTYAMNPGCSGIKVVPNGWIASRLVVFKWSGSAWTACRETNWSYGGGGNIVQGDITYTQSAQAYLVFSGTNPGCGAGYYGTQGYHYVFDGAVWQGGTTWSGYQYVS